MRKCTWILVYAQLFHTWAQVIELSSTPCNDKKVEKLSRLALTYTNEDRTTGYKFALNRITNVHLHAQGPAGNVYYLNLDVLETKCHIGSPQPWKRCDVRPFKETQISGNCNTTILHTAEGFSYLYSYDCTLVPDPPEKLLQMCPDCPLLLPTDSPQAVHAAGLTLHKYNAQSTLPSSLALQNITRASSQGGPMQASFVEYTVQECPEGHLGTCVPTNKGKQPVGFCKGAVYGDVKRQPDVDVTCEIFHPQRVNVGGPAQPQVHDVTPPHLPTVPDFGSHVPIFFPSFPTLPPSVTTGPRLVDPRVDPNPPNSITVSPLASSESSEELGGATSESDSSEELVGTVIRPPFNFRYSLPQQRRRRRRRQALGTPKPPHTPVFLSVFPSSPSPFRSCPGPSRYTTV